MFIYAPVCQYVHFKHAAIGQKYALEKWHGMFLFASTVLPAKSDSDVVFC